MCYVKPIEFTWCCLYVRGYRAICWSMSSLASQGLHLLRKLDSSFSSRYQLPAAPQLGLGLWTLPICARILAVYRSYTGLVHAVTTMCAMASSHLANTVFMYYYKHLLPLALKILVSPLLQCSWALERVLHSPSFSHNDHLWFFINRHLLQKRICSDEGREMLLLHEYKVLST